MRLWKMAGTMLLCLLLSGCGNPETTRFSTGDRAIIFEHSSSGGERYDGVWLEKCIDAKNMFPGPKLGYGTHISIVEDAEQPDRERGTRAVRVHVEDGPYAGFSGEVTRWSLRPAK